MKIKTDFVTNSSSSSFLVVFPRTYTSEEDLRTILPYFTEIVFRDMQEETPIKIEFSEECIEIVLTKISNGFPDLPEKYGGKKKKPYSYDYYVSDDNIYSNPEKALKKRIKNENLINPNIKINFNHPYIERISKEQDLESLLNAKKATESFIDLNKGNLLFVFEYSDETELGSQLEQGEHFDKAKIEYIKVSNH